MTRSTRLCTLLALSGALAAAGCRAAVPEGRSMHEADGDPRSAPVVGRIVHEPSVYTDPFQVRSAPRVMSWWIPSHVSGERLIGGHTMAIEVEPAKWWVEGSGPQNRPEPQTVGAIRNDHRSRPTEALWNAALRGSFVPWRGTPRGDSRDGTGHLE